MRFAWPMSSGAARTLSSSPVEISASIRSSTSSGSLKPSREKNLMPLSWYGLWLAEIMTPASQRMSAVRNAMPGVGIGPTWSTSTPIEQIPAASASSNM
jgi:hypothetical protein